MQACKLSALLFVQVFPSNAMVIPIRSLVENYSSAAIPATGAQPWSKQDVLTLVGVCVAVVTVIIGLIGVLIASPKAREWLCRPIFWLTQRGSLSKRTPLDLRCNKGSRLNQHPGILKICRRDIDHQPLKTGRGKITERSISKCNAVTMSC